METFELIIYFILFVVLFTFIGLGIHNKIKTSVLKINSIESEIDRLLREKYDLIEKIIILMNSEKENDLSNSVEELKDTNYSSFEFDRKLLEIENLIIDFKNNNKLDKNKDLNNKIYVLSNLNTKFKAAETYYNENIFIYNNLVTKFPSKIVSGFMHLKEKKYFDGKDMYDKNIKDFKI